MNRIFKFALLLVLFVSLEEIALGQGAATFKKHRYTSIGVAINAMNYVGELDPGPSFISPGIKFTRPNFAVTYTKRIAPRYSLRGAVSWGRIKGNDYDNASFANKDINRKFRNLSFRSSILEVKADFVIDLWENRGRHTKRPDYTPYFFGGLAYFHMNPKTKYEGRWVELEPLQLEGTSFSLHQISIPVGLGFRYKLGKQWDLAFEMGWRFTLTDYMDGVSKNYVDKSTFGDNQVAIDLSDRSGELFGNEDIGPAVLQQGTEENPTGFAPDPYNTSGYRILGYGSPGDKRGDSNRDWYIVTGFHLNYIIPERVICPKFRTFYKKLDSRLLAKYE